MRPISINNSFLRELPNKMLKNGQTFSLALQDESQRSLSAHLLTLLQAVLNRYLLFHPTDLKGVLSRKSKFVLS